jgi:hypothetical protein
LGTDVDLDRLIDSVKGMEIDLYTSNESISLQAEYIRDGLVWDDWANNIEKLLQSYSLRGLHIMCTINALSLDTLPHFLDVVTQWKNEWGRDFPVVSLNILRFPSFQSPLVLPDELRTKYKENLMTWVKNNSDSEVFHEMEWNQINRLIDYLDVVKTPHADAAVQSVLQQDFKAFYTQYDQRRGKNFTETFPALADWYNTL